MECKYKFSKKHCRNKWATKAWTLVSYKAAHLLLLESIWGATLKIIMSGQWVYMYYTIIEYGEITVIVDDTVTDKMKKGFW